MFRTTATAARLTDYRYRYRYRYTGANTATAFNFMSGSGGAVHATLCSTGLGMYGPSKCTTDSGLNCYTNGNSCSTVSSSTSMPGSCIHDAGQRAAMSLKLV